MKSLSFIFTLSPSDNLSNSSFFRISSAESRRINQGYYEEVRTLGGSCFPRDTCAFLNNSTEDHLWGDRTCECGDHCVRHGTCCVDSRYSGIEYRSSNHLQESCQKVQNNIITVTMVSQCPSAWQKSYVNGRCISPEGRLEDPLSTVPVTSLTTRTTYRNYFCALCNDDANSILMWDIEAKLSLVDDTSNSVGASVELMERLEYNVEKGSWGVQYVDAETNDQQFRKIKLKFALPTGLKKMVKQCHPRIVSDCSSSLRSSSLRQRCLAYYSPIRARKDGSSVFVDYRNIHCALCNGFRVRPNNVACPKIRSIKKDRPSPDPRRAVRYQHRGRRQRLQGRPSPRPLLQEVQVTGVCHAELRHQKRCLRQIRVNGCKILILYNLQVIPSEEYSPEENHTKVNNLKGCIPFYFAYVYWTSHVSKVNISFNLSC
ncbi:uncharacterized protein CEXT_350141 [Caerostris extrusa]|uniref:SMB domain-containing protein n=1 Tax=Caerostris extrusa TaxID=172846 RepID=A0AAV4P483_CAEEX|nr:uncharacterized protein CEXT_350141 [Caerostris extrusa]